MYIWFSIIFNPKIELSPTFMTRHMFRDGLQPATAGWGMVVVLRRPWGLREPCVLFLMVAKRIKKICGWFWYGSIISHELPIIAVSWAKNFRTDAPQIWSFLVWNHGCEFSGPSLDKRTILGDGRPQTSTHHLETFARTLRQTLGFRGRYQVDRGAVGSQPERPGSCVSVLTPLWLWWSDGFPALLWSGYDRIVFYKLLGPNGFAIWRHQNLWVQPIPGFAWWLLLEWCNTDLRSRHFHLGRENTILHPLNQQTSRRTGHCVFWTMISVLFARSYQGWNNFRHHWLMWNFQESPSGQLPADQH